MVSSFLKVVALPFRTMPDLTPPDPTRPRHCLPFHGVVDGALTRNAPEVHTLPNQARANRTVPDLTTPRPAAPRRSTPGVGSWFLPEAS